MMRYFKASRTSIYSNTVDLSRRDQHRAGVSLPDDSNCAVIDIERLLMAEEDFVSKLTGDKRLSLAHRELHELPLQIVNKFGTIARELDLTGNNITYVNSL